MRTYHFKKAADRDGSVTISGLPPDELKSTCWKEN